MIRRKFLALLAGLVPAPLLQQAIMEGRKAVVCDDGPFKCPLGHDTCATIDKPIAVGNDSIDYPEVAQLRNYDVIRCDVCHVVFTRQ